MGALKNMIKGIFFLILYIITTIIIPIFIYSAIRDLDASGINVSFTQQDYDDIIFWITALGIIICGCAFFTHSSPKQSVRKALFALIQSIVNCFYIWSYRYSGASEIAFEFSSLGGIYLDISAMISFTMGIYFLYILLRVYDLIDFLVNKKKIQEKRRK